MGVTTILTKGNSSIEVIKQQIFKSKGCQYFIGKVKIRIQYEQHQPASNKACSSCKLKQPQNQTPNKSTPLPSILEVGVLPCLRLKVNSMMIVALVLCY